LAGQALEAMSSEALRSLLFLTWVTFATPVPTLSPDATAQVNAGAPRDETGLALYVAIPGILSLCLLCVILLLIIVGRRRRPTTDIDERDANYEQPLVSLQSHDLSRMESPFVSEGLSTQHRRQPSQDSDGL
jgi:hypothetical protein